jgi:hypothetical protein
MRYVAFESKTEAGGDHDWERHTRGQLILCRYLRRDRRMEGRHITGTPEGREPVYGRHILYGVSANGEVLPDHGLDVEEGMLTGDAVYGQLKPLCGVRAMRL